MTQQPIHTPVLLDEVVTGLAVRDSAYFIDGTLGDGGHAEAILDAGGSVLGIDRDPSAIAFATARLAPYGSRFTAVNATFADLADVVRAAAIPHVDGILLDLGLSSRQLENSGRGFSFSRDEPLDMRFDPAHDISAKTIVNSLSESDLADLLRSYGEEPLAKRIARAIVRHRPLATTTQLVDAILSATGKRPQTKTHPTTRTFQALRIHVNDELDALQTGLTQALDTLAPGGRIAVISYHSLEDRLVKNTLRTESTECLCPPRLPICVCGHHATLKILARKAIQATQNERENNPRSRSARLRLAERIE